jgi:hypothetical protein
MLAVTRQSHVNFWLDANDVKDLNSFVLSKVPIWYLFHYSGDLSTAPRQVA